MDPKLRDYLHKTSFIHGFNVKNWGYIPGRILFVATPDDFFLLL